MPTLKPRPPSWCYPPSTEFECDACGALPAQECDPAPLYGPTVEVVSGTVHLVRARTRAAEVLRRVRVWETQEGGE